MSKADIAAKLKAPSGKSAATPQLENEAPKPKKKKEKTQKEQTLNEGGESAELEPFENDPRFEQFYKDLPIHHEGLGYVRVCVKAQKGRSSIGALLFRPDENAKWVQKLQVVIKPPQILKMDAMAILKFASALWMDKAIEESDLKKIKDKLVSALLAGKIMDAFIELWPSGYSDLLPAWSELFDIRDRVMKERSEAGRVKNRALRVPKPPPLSATILFRPLRPRQNPPPFGRHDNYNRQPHHFSAGQALKEDAAGARAVCRGSVVSASEQLHIGMSVSAYSCNRCALLGFPSCS